MQDPVGFENSKCLDKRYAGVKPPPLTGVPHPVNIKAVFPHAVDASEGRIEFLTTIVRHARPVALHEAISPRRPRAMDVDDVIPLRRPDLGRNRGFKTSRMKVSQAAMIACFSSSSIGRAGRVARAI